jgi:hypothetical protein
MKSTHIIAFAVAALLALWRSQLGHRIDGGSRAADQQC